MTRARVLTAAVVVPAVVVVVWWGSTGLVAALLSVVVVLALVEFFALGKTIGIRGYRVWTCVCALLLILQQWMEARKEIYALRDGLSLTREDGFSLTVAAVLVIFVLGAASIVLFNRRPLAEALPALSLSAAALVFVALPLSYIVRLHGAAPSGPRLLLFTLVTVWVGDTLAYFVGRGVGRIPMAGRLSPKKTWEGAAANLLGALVVALALAGWLNVETRQLLVLAALANIAAQSGDLLESAYKRSAGVKDSGALLPGHGGMLDRIDALVLAAPVVWYYFHWVIARGG